MKSNTIGLIIGGVIALVVITGVIVLSTQRGVDDTQDTFSDNQDISSEEMGETLPADPMDSNEPSTGDDISMDSAPNDTSVLTIPMDDVAQNNTAESCWTVIEGNVYDLTEFIGRHPGGMGAISSICGRDGTSEFEGQASHGVSASQQLESLQIGILE